MNKLISKIKSITEGFSVGYNDTLGNYTATNFDYFYLYFNSHDKEVRRHSFFLFMYLLGNVYAGHQGVLPCQKQIEESEDYTDFYYDFEKYLKAFLLNYKSLQEDFPNTFHYTIYYLNNIEKTIEMNFEDYYSEIPKELFDKLRYEILEPNKKMGKMKELPHMKYLLHEMQIKPFFMNDFL